MNRRARRAAAAIERKPKSGKPLNSHGNHKLFVKVSNTRRKVVK